MLRRKYFGLVFGLGVAAFGEVSASFGQAAMPGLTREGVALQVLQTQRNGALDAVVGCTADREVLRAELQGKIDDLTKKLAEAVKGDAK